MADSGKPAAVVERIIEGKLDKWYVRCLPAGAALRPQPGRHRPADADRGNRQVGRKHQGRRLQPPGHRRVVTASVDQCPARTGWALLYLDLAWPARPVAAPALTLCSRSPAASSATLRSTRPMMPREDGMCGAQVSAHSAQAGRRGAGGRGWVRHQPAAGGVPGAAKSRRSSTWESRWRVVIGGGNLWRGKQDGLDHGMERVTADHMGMLATVMNSLALQDALERLGLPTRVHDGHRGARRRRAIHPAARRPPPGKGARRSSSAPEPATRTSRPTQPPACAPWRSTPKCLIKATKVDAVYDSDPKKNADAQRFNRLTYIEALNMRRRRDGQHGHGHVHGQRPADPGGQPLDGRTHWLRW